MSFEIDLEAANNALVAMNLRKAIKDAAEKRASIVPAALLRKGDLPGHEFHGNQYAGGQDGGSNSTESGRVPENDKVSSRDARVLAAIAAGDIKGARAILAGKEPKGEGSNSTASGKVPENDKVSPRDARVLNALVAGDVHGARAILAGKKIDAGDLSKIHNPHKVHNRTTGKWRVVDDDGHQYGEHASEADADAQLAALYQAKAKE